MIRRLRWLVPFAFLFASCSSFAVQREQILLRYRPEADVLDAVLIYEGVGASDGVGKAVSALGQIAHGRRHFMIGGWPLDVDLEELVRNGKEEGEDEEGEDPDNELDEATRAFTEYQTNISVDGSRLLHDQENDGRLCLVQRVRVRQASRALRLLDLCWNADVLQEAKNRKKGSPSADASTEELQLARARDGGSWSRFEGPELVISIPMSPEGAASLMRGWLPAHAGKKGADHMTPQLLDSLSSILVTGDELRLRFAPAADGWIHFRLFDEKQDYAPDVAESLERDGLVAAGELEDEIRRLKELP